MALSTTQYGYIIDPMVPFTDDKGKTIKNGFVRVFVAGSSTPVVTYRNFDGATNTDRIELDNSGRTMTSVIGSKGLTYKVCVYDQHHSQESPILTVDKVSVIGANITAGTGATLVTGLDGLTTKPDGFVDASVVGTDGYVAIDHTLVTDDLDTDAKVTAVEDDRYIPLLNEDVNDPDSKMTLGRLWQWVLGKIKSLSTTITAFRTGDYIAVDGPDGTAKMGKADLLRETAENALGSIQSLSDTATEADLVAGNFLAIDGSAGTKKLPAGIFAKQSDVSLFFDKTVTITENFVDVSCTVGDVICASVKGLTARIVISNQNSTIFLNQVADGVFFFNVTELTTQLKVWVDTAGVEIKLGLIRASSINAVLKLIDEKNIKDVSAYSDQDDVLDFANGVSGGHYQWDLSWVSSSSYQCSTHFPVAKGEIFVVKRASNQYAELVGFDADDNCVYFDSSILSGSANQEFRIKNTTDNIVSYSIQINTTASVLSWVKVFRVQEWMQCVFNTMLENAPISDEWTYIENDSLVIGSYSTSLVYSSSTTDMYGVYNVEGLTRVKINTPTNQWIANVFFEDENGTKFGRTAGGDRIIPVPSNAKKMYVYTPTSYIEAMNVWVNKTPPKTFFFGKRIAFFGTSIPAGFGAGLTSQNVCSYPKVMGKYLYCKVENLAVGSSCVCCKREDLISTSNPYGFTSDFHKCSRCLTNSINEMNWIISNYNNGTFVYNVPASISADEANQIRSYSYENRVKQLFDGTLDPVDVILIEHGHNDDDTPDFTTDTDCSGGLYTYAGAMKFLLDYIYSFNPRQKVALVSHYENWRHVGTHDILTAQKNVANYFEIPLVDIANACGWGNYPITTKGNWVLYGSLSFWEATEDAHTFADAVQLWIPDGTHPHTDRTGKADRHIARLLAGKLQNIGW